MAVARAPLAILPNLNVGMSQSSVIGASLVGGFLLYLMIQGKLGNYWSILMGGSASSAPTQMQTTGPGQAPAGQTPGSGGTLVQPQLPGAPKGLLVPPLQLTPGMQGN